MNIAWELADAAGADVLFTGRLPRKQSSSLSLQDSQAEASLTAYSFDTLLLGSAAHLLSPLDSERRGHGPIFGSRPVLD